MAAQRKRSHPVVPHSFTPKVEGPWWFCPTWQLLRRNFYDFLVQSPTSVAVVGTGSLAQLPARHDHRTMVFSCLDSSNPFTHKLLMSKMVQYSLNRQGRFCNTKIERKNLTHRRNVVRVEGEKRERNSVWSESGIYFSFQQWNVSVVGLPGPTEKKRRSNEFSYHSCEGTKFYKFL